MSFISTGVEYGLHCMLFLTQSHSQVGDASVRDLAELQGVPTEFLAKLFTRLARAELVVATEGVKGGFRLARPAHRISVLDVVVAIDGDKPLFDCREIRSRCAVFDDEAPPWATRGVCTINAVMQLAEKAMRTELKRHTLDDLAGRIVDKAPAGYGGQIVEWFTERAAGRQAGKPAGGRRA